MNKPKLEDVMRALECCNTKGNCNHCPYEILGQYTICYGALTQDALALIREKDARIKELEEAQGEEFTCFVGDPHKVDHCPYGDEILRLQKDVAEKDEALEDAYDYIRRLEAVKKIRDEEISEHQKKIEQLQIATMKKDAEIEHLKMREKVLTQMLDDGYNEWEDYVRAEAITEFAERVKEAVKYIPWCDYPPVHNCIDEIAEKLKGETE